jgi:hypothetical protein
MHIAFGKYLIVVQGRQTKGLQRQKENSKNSNGRLVINLKSKK